MPPINKLNSKIKALQHLYTAKFIEDKFEREMLIEVINMKVGLVDDAINLGIKKGEKRGIKKGKIEIIQSMLLNGISPESIAESTNIDLEFIESVHLSK